jgi:hypothetical protein
MSTMSTIIIVPDRNEEPRMPWFFFILIILLIFLFRDCDSSEGLEASEASSTWTEYSRVRVKAVPSGHHLVTYDGFEVDCYDRDHTTRKFIMHVGGSRPPKPGRVLYIDAEVHLDEQGRVHLTDVRPVDTEASHSERPKRARTRWFGPRNQHRNRR